MSSATVPAVTEIVHRLAAHGLTVATAESLTAGLIVSTLVTVPGASAVVRGGLVTYATDLKAELAGVDRELLARSGAVDPEVARQMALGAARVCRADVGVSCTGVAGPDPQDGKPVGLVYLGLASPDGVVVQERRFEGDRAAIRLATVNAAIDLLGRGAGEPA
ncbi:CinA family protein [Brevibacterium daeguense]|uniref:CinA family protein n=1 Tax=Brevibacterium daeguense TaxID=909936 RepID=A0ABP8ELZ4_9MICO